MAKPEWGTKRTCDKCSARFYDLSRDPAVCPQCGTRWSPKPASRGARGLPPVPVNEVPVGKEGVAEDLEVEIEDKDEIDDVGDEPEPKAGGGGDEEEVIEGASELVEDEEDVAGTIDHGDKPKR